MTWFRVDDKLTMHPKWLAAGQDARSVWFEAAVWSASQLTDGQIPRGALALMGTLAKIAGSADKAAAELVKLGLWDRSPGGWYIHDWLDLQPSRDDVETRRATWSRDKRLHRDVDLLAEIRTRDRDCCRYCRAPVGFGKSRPSGLRAGQYDHVDPDLPPGALNDLGNVVICCARCNKVKGHRNPVDAGMILLDPPTPFVGQSADITSDSATPTGRDGSGTSRTASGRSSGRLSSLAGMPGLLRVVTDGPVPVVSL
jgi:5-methylcytosine-specific restriction endonuclease McrA